MVKTVQILNPPIWHTNPLLSLLSEPGGYFTVLGDKPSPEMMACWMKGREAFSEGIDVFVEIDDVANQALLHCNCGRLMRLCATTYTQIVLNSDKQEFTPKERQYFQKVRSTSSVFFCLFCVIYSLSASKKKSSYCDHLIIIIVVAIVQKL